MKLDKKLTAEIQEKWIEKIKVFFYDAGCSGSKVNIVFDDFEIDESLVKTQDEFAIYVEKEDEEKFEWCSITRVQKADHSWEVKTRYIYASEKVLDRCGCGSSFWFEKKKPKIDLAKLKDLKTRFN